MVAVLLVLALTGSDDEGKRGQHGGKGKHGKDRQGTAGGSTPATGLVEPGQGGVGARATAMRVCLVPGDGRPLIDARR